MLERRIPLVRFELICDADSIAEFNEIPVDKFEEDSDTDSACDSKFAATFDRVARIDDVHDPLP